jgi:hypothetical protein
MAHIILITEVLSPTPERFRDGCMEQRGAGLATCKKNIEDRWIGIGMFA